MDLILRGRFGRRSHREPEVPGKQQETFPYRRVFGGGPKQGRAGTIRPNAHETTLDDTSSIRTGTTHVASTASDDDDVINIVRPELDDSPGHVRGAKPGSSSLFQGSLNSNPRGRPSWPRFSAVTMETGRETQESTSEVRLKANLEALLRVLDMGGEVETDKQDDAATTNAARGRLQWAPLHYAAQSGKTSFCQSLIDHGANIEVEDEDKWTPLFFSAKGGQLETCRLLLDRGANPNALGTDGRTALILAASKGHLEVAKLLISRGADPDFPSKEPSQIGAPLSFAALSNHMDIAELLLAEGAEVDVVDETLKTPLALAAMKGHLKMMQFLIDKGANVYAKDHRQWTILHLVTQHDREHTLEATRILLDAGADINEVTDRNTTALGLSALEGRLDVAELLAARGADFNYPEDAAGRALGLVVHNGTVEFIRFFLAHGANPHYVIPEKGGGMLHIAAARKDPEAIIHLLEAGLDPNLVDFEGHTPLHVASQNDNDEIGLALLRYGARP